MALPARRPAEMLKPVGISSTSVLADAFRLTAFSEIKNGRLASRGGPRRYREGSSSMQPHAAEAVVPSSSRMEEQIHRRRVLPVEETLAACP